MRRAHAQALAAAAVLAAATAAAAASPEEELVAAKCTLCHTKSAIYAVDSARLKETVERMCKDLLANSVIENYAYELQRA